MSAPAVGSLPAYLAVAGVLFLLGIVAILTRRNALYVLMGVELILNAANLNFVAFARFRGLPGAADGVTAAALLDGQMFALFVVVLAAAEAAIALAIVLRVFNDFGSIDVTRTDSLRN
ncbi:MAG: NADH-quinone oxidoreductase subunit NuoK [Planctomycetota bacterium]